MPRQAPDLTARDYQQIIPLGLHSDTVKPRQAIAIPMHSIKRVNRCRHCLPMQAERGSRTFAPSRWLDAVFIGFLEEHPQRGGEIFFRLFNRVPSDALVRFLSDQARPSDVIRVMKALPMGAFIRQALRHVVRA